MSKTVLAINKSLVEPRTFDLHGVALKHSALQVFYNILNFKKEYETRHGVMTSEELSKIYLENIRFAKEDEAVTCLQAGGGEGFLLSVVYVIFLLSSNGCFTC